MNLQRFSAAAALLAGLLAGCATPTRMAFQDDAQRLDVKSKPVLLMVANFRNTYRPDYQPRLIVAHVEKAGASQASDRINFTMDDKARMETRAAPAGNTYLLRMELDPGKYELKTLTSMSGGFPIVGTFHTPLLIPFEVRENGVYYLGRINATVRERQGGEFRAGPPIPLIDQAVVGASGGTFEVEIVDAQAQDEALFLTRFPALRGVSIRKAVLPAFDRPRAQQWWEKN